MKIKNVLKYARHPLEVFYKMARKGKLNWMPDKLYLKLMFRRFTGKSLRLRNPRTFNEKLQWIKLYDRKPEYAVMVDKFAVKEYVAKKIGAQYVVPTIKCWDKIEDVSFDGLPEKFVMKCTHDSGGLVICKDKSSLDRDAALKKIEKSFNFDYFPLWREWPYKGVKPRIIVEQFLDDGNASLNDYKVLCFNGVPRLIELHRGRYQKHTQDFYDEKWNHLPFRQGHDEIAGDVYAKPAFLDEMLRLSEILSKDIPHVRVDWYYVENKLYFGELTFFDSSGFDDFDPAEYNEIVGSWLQLPAKRS